MKFYLKFGFTALGLVVSTSAFAQDWAASCGAEPKAPVINVANITSYNTSVEHFTAYDKAVRAYYKCVTKISNTKQTAIRQKAAEDMKAYQKATSTIGERITANLSKSRSELVAGGKKLGAKPKK